METDELPPTSPDAWRNVLSKASPITDAKYISCNAVYARVEQQGALLKYLLDQDTAQDSDRLVFLTLTDFIVLNLPPQNNILYCAFSYSLHTMTIQTMYIQVSQPCKAKIRNDFEQI